MNFKQYKQEVIEFGQSIGWDFYFETDIRTSDIILKSSANNLNPNIKIFSHEYVYRNEDWNAELEWLKTKILR